MPEHALQHSRAFREERRGGEAVSLNASVATVLLT